MAPATHEDPWSAAQVLRRGHRNGADAPPRVSSTAPADRRLPSLGAADHGLGPRVTRSHDTVSARQSLARDLRPSPTKGRRGWRKLHTSVDSRGMILARRLTEATGDDANTALDLLGRIKGTTTCVTAYDAAAIYEAAAERGARIVVPPAPARSRCSSLRRPSHGRRWGGDQHREGLPDLVPRREEPAQGPLGRYRRNQLIQAELHLLSRAATRVMPSSPRRDPMTRSRSPYAGSRGPGVFRGLYAMRGVNR